MLVTGHFRRMLENQNVDEFFKIEKLINNHLNIHTAEVIYYEFWPFYTCWNRN